MKKLYFLLITGLFASFNSYAQLDVSSVSGGPTGNGSWLRFLSGGNNTSIQENYGLNLTGTNIQPVKIANTSLLVGYTSGQNQNFANGNALISGSVGIGTMSPVSKLSVWGDNATLWGLTLGWGTRNAIITTDDNTKPISFQIAGNEAMRISNSGYLGIGTSSPDARLTVGGSGIVANLSNFSDQDLKFSLSTPGATDKYSLIAPSTATNLALGVGGAEKMRIDVNGNVGVGTTTPKASVEISKYSPNAQGPVLELTNTGANPGATSEIYFSTYNRPVYQDPAAKIKVSDNGQYGGSFYFDTKGPVSVNNQVQYSLINRMYIDAASGYVGIGTTSPDANLAVNGNIHARSVNIDLNVPTNLVPDYVFKKDYHLQSLSDLKRYVDVHSHLPEVPSAKEIEKNGINVLDMNLKLLKKVEELTLYIVEQDKRIKRLEKRTITGKHYSKDAKITY